MDLILLERLFLVLFELVMLLSDCSTCGRHTKGLLVLSKGDHDCLK